MSNVLHNKTILTINVESTDIDLKKGRIFQVSIGIGKLNSSKWLHKTWRVEGIDIPERYIALFKNGEIPKIDDDCLVSIEKLLETLTTIIGKVDVVCTFFNSFHIGMLYSEYQRAGMSIPDMHICDLFLIFKESHKYEKGLKKSFDGAISYYDESLETFGDERNLLRKVQAYRWLLDRLIEDDDCSDFFSLDSIESLNRVQSRTNVISYYSSIKYLKSKGKSTDNFNFMPWPYHSDGSGDVEEDNPLFEDVPEVMLTLLEISNPDKEEEIKDEIPFEVSYQNEVHQYLTEQLNLEYEDSDRFTLSFDNTSEFEVLAGKNGFNHFVVHLKCEKKDINQLLKVVESWPIRWVNRNTFMKIMSSISEEDMQIIEFKLMEKLNFE